MIICRPADPEAKGLVERLHDYLERSFLPGRTFASPADFNTQLQVFLARANTRQHRTLGCRPADRIDADRAAMLGLPPLTPAVGWQHSTRLPRYIRLDSNDYSVHPGVIGRRIEVSGDLAQVRVICEGKVVADHERAWAKHQTISDPEHVTTARALRRERLEIERPAAEPEVGETARRRTDPRLLWYDHPPSAQPRRPPPGQRRALSGRDRQPPMLRRCGRQGVFDGASVGRLFDSLLRACQTTSLNRRSSGRPT